MSQILDRILAQSLDELPATVMLSPESMAVVLFLTAFGEDQKNWLELNENPADVVTPEQWDVIERMMGNLIWELLHPMIGMVFPVLNGLFPQNMLPCQGGTFLRVDYPRLYAVLDEAFIVDADQFRLPDLTGMTVIGAGDQLSPLPSYVAGDVGGEALHTLTVTELPSHNHGLERIGGPSAGVLGYGLASLQTQVPFRQTLNTGGGQAHNNMQPYVVLAYGVIAR